MRFSSLMVAAAIAFSAPTFADSNDNRTSSEDLQAPRMAVSAIMTEVGQALVWDAIQGEYVVVRAGSMIQGFRVRAIFPEQIVVEGKRSGEHFVFSLGPSHELRTDAGRRTRAHGSAKPAPVDPYGPSVVVAPSTGVKSVTAPPASRSPGPPAVSSPGPVDPYAPAETGSPGPVDPYAPAETGSPGPVDPYAPAETGSPGPVDPYAPRKPSPSGPVASVMAPPGSRASAAPAPVDPYAPKKRASESGRRGQPAATPAKPAAPAKPVKPPVQGPMDPYAAPLDPYAGGAAQVPPTVVQPGASTSAKAKVVTLNRRELESSLADFHALSQEISVEPASGRGFKVTSLQRGSYFHRLGIRTGDVILKVAGVPLRSVEDAAQVYAQIASMSSFRVELTRRGRAKTLEFRFKSR